MTNNNFSIELNNLQILGEGVYVGSLSVKTIASLMNNGLLNEMHNKSNTKKTTEIKELLLKEKLISTRIIIGIRENGVTYNSEINSLTVNEIGKMNIIDGYHRCLASTEAYKENPNIDFNFIVRIIVGNEGLENEIKNSAKKMKTIN